MDVWFDAKQMQKVINNLISNALKHTKKDGIITIKVGKENNEAVIDVNDTGAGIAPEDIDKIYFYKSVIETTEGVMIYAKRLSEYAKQLAQKETNYNHLKIIDNRLTI